MLGEKYHIHKNLGAKNTLFMVLNNNKSGPNNKNYYFVNHNKKKDVINYTIIITANKVEN